LDLHAILIRAPVNRLAARVVSQRDLGLDSYELQREEICCLIDRLRRKHKLLKHVLKIKTKAQHKNLMYKHSKGLKQYRKQNEPRAFSEYLIVGREIQRLCRALQEMSNLG
jgi:hypothetical protein